MSRIRLDPSARDRILTVLASLSTKTRALIADHLEGSTHRRTTTFFYAVAGIRDTIEETMGDLNPRIVSDLERLQGLCFGPLSRYRSTIQEAISIVHGSSVLGFGLRCPHCGGKRPHEDLSCDSCGG